MLSSSDEKKTISSLGWVDEGNLSVWSAQRGAATSEKLSEAKYLKIFSGENDYFSVQHTYGPQLVEFSIHSFEKPSNTLAKLVLRDGEAEFAGDSTLWDKVPSVYVEYLSYDEIEDYHLIVIGPESRTVELQTFAWFDDSYDHGYQGILGATEIPGQREVIVSIQRDSNPIIYDPETRTVRGKLKLAQRLGNPTLQFRRSARELWADDYDTLLRLDPSDWSIQDKVRLQKAPKGSRQFIGSYAFNKDETLCIVARPFSGDVAAVDTLSFKVDWTKEIGHQPLEANVSSDGNIVTRDWKTGEWSASPV